MSSPPQPAGSCRRCWAAFAGLGVVALLAASQAGPAAGRVIGPYVPIVVAATLAAAFLAVPGRGR